MKKHIQQHRNKFFVVFALLMVVVFTYFMWPVKEGVIEPANTGSNGLSVP